VTVAFDLSRIHFDPVNDYAGVVMEQGRVQLDSDWNEWLAELNRRIQAETLDLLGHAAYPSTTPAAFEIKATGPTAITIGCGRMYVDGLLAENHGDTADEQWDPALAELSGSPQPPPTQSKAIDFLKQPYLPGAQLPQGNGPFLFYLDVWIRAVTWLQDPDLIDKAVGVDTAGRLQTVWQVKWLDIPQGESYTCATPDSEIPYPPDSTGLLTTGTVPLPASGPCCLSDGTGYTGLENQTYRVEMHLAGVPIADPTTFDPSSDAAFKWSRDNASVATGVTAMSDGTNIAGGAAKVLTVMSLGRDEVLGFAAGDWIELLDDWTELAGAPGVLCQIDSVDVASRSITLTTTLPPSPIFDATDPKRHTRIVRWDQSATIYKVNTTTLDLEPWCDLAATGGLIPVPNDDTTLVLEDGITVTFTTTAASGSFNVGDFWTFAARTADGTVDILTGAPPRGIHHHYTKLSVVDLSGPSPSTPDCRTPWPPGGGDACGCCCTVAVGPGGFSTIQAALEKLPKSGGEVCIMPGRYFERVVLDGLTDVVIRGCGAQTSIASPSLDPNTTEDGPAVDSADSAVAASGLSAVITLVDCEHVQLRSFAVEADDGDVGILLERASRERNPDEDLLLDFTDEELDDELHGMLVVGRVSPPGDVDVTIEDTFLTASNRPAVAALDAELLTISRNRIAMANVRSTWPAVHVSGTEIRIDRNWVGVQSPANAAVREPTSVWTDLGANLSLATRRGRVRATGGIRIAGPSRDVVVVDNEVEGGIGNGITLGSFAVLDRQGTDTGLVMGVFPQPRDDCTTTSTLLLPSTLTVDRARRTIVSGGRLLNVAIDRNRIRSMGLCGVGPVGFFDFTASQEVISIENLTVTGNEISDTLLLPVSSQDDTLRSVAFSSLGYGAISVPDVRGLVIRDNAITDYGATPGAAVCGIFLSHAEGAELSRNRIIQTSDFDPSSDGALDPGIRAGIGVLFVTPPTVEATTTANELRAYTAVAAPAYDAEWPALRVEHNVVRVPVGLALGATGLGAFTIVNNFFSSGELTDDTGVATVAVMNLGMPVELERPAIFWRMAYESTATTSEALGGGGTRSAAAGAVLFTDNVCELEASTTSAQRQASSVFVTSYDHLLFANNHCRVQGPESCLALDALLYGSTLQVESNRLQEALGSVSASGVTAGLANITSANLSTYCIYASGSMLATPNNLVLAGGDECDSNRRLLEAAILRSEVKQ
jgi:hypothetical protein